MRQLLKLSFLFLVFTMLIACAPEPKTSPPVPNSTTLNDIKITPIMHATAVLEWDGQVIYSDPTGGAEAFSGQPSPDLVLVTDIHSDHLSPETLRAVLTDTSVLIVPQAVADQLPEGLKGNTEIMVNGDIIQEQGFSIEAIPMYNLPESPDSRHTKGRGNGYVLEREGKRVYFTGDSADIPEMRALRNIDIAFVAMNLPFTMSVEDAADAVLEFKPKKVYPYHYREEGGFSDVAKFKRLVNEGDPDIEVIQLDWYPTEA